MLNEHQVTCSSSFQQSAVHSKTTANLLPQSCRIGINGVSRLCTQLNLRACMGLLQAEWDNKCTDYPQKLIVALFSFLRIISTLVISFGLKEPHACAKVQLCAQPGDTVYPNSTWLWKEIGSCFVPLEMVQKPRRYETMNSTRAQVLWLTAPAVWHAQIIIAPTPCHTHSA